MKKRNILVVLIAIIIIGAFGWSIFHFATNSKTHDEAKQGNQSIQSQKPSDGSQQANKQADVVSNKAAKQLFSIFNDSLQSTPPYSKKFTNIIGDGIYGMQLYGDIFTGTNLQKDICQIYYISKSDISDMLKNSGKTGTPFIPNEDSWNTNESIDKIDFTKIPVENIPELQNFDWDNPDTGSVESKLDDIYHGLVMLQNINYDGYWHVYKLMDGSFVFTNGGRSLFVQKGAKDLEIKVYAIN